MTNHICFDARILTAYLTGQLSDAEAQRLEEEIGHCDKCDETVREVELELKTDLLQITSHDELDGDGNYCDDSAFRKAIRSVRSWHVADEASPLSDRIRMGEFGQYVLGRQIGSGGMGAVYEARHTPLDRTVAIKFPYQGRAAKDIGLTERFKQESVALAKLDHPNLVRALDAGVAEDGPFLVMEFVTGTNVRDLVQDAGPLPVAAAVDIACQVAHGLDYIESRGFVHRDIKPSNLIQNASGVVKILDLGLARPLVDSEDLTGSGHLVGTLDYMAPEQAEQSHAADASADVYSLGATLYTLLTGCAPFGGPEFRSPLKKLKALAQQTPRPLLESCPGVPAALAQLVERMLSKQPSQRPSAADVVVVLGALVDADAEPRTDTAMPAATSQPVRSAAASVGWWVGGAAIAALLMMAVVVRINTRLGTIVLEGDPAALKGVEVFVDDQIVRLRRGKTTIEVEPDEKRHVLRITKDGHQTFTEEYVANFRRKKIRIHLEPTLPVIVAGKPVAPIGSCAIIDRPSKLPGVDSFTIETIAPRGPITAAAMSPKNQRLATFGGDGSIRIWRLPEANLERILIAPSVAASGTATPLAWSPDGSSLAYIGGWPESRSIRVWNIDSGSLLFSTDEAAIATSIGWSADGKLLATAGTSLQLWKIGVDSPFDTLIPEPEGNDIRTVLMEWSSDVNAAQQLFTAQSNTGEDAVVTSWDAQTGEPVSRFNVSHAVRELATSPNNDFIALRIDNTRVAIRRAENGKLVDELKATHWQSTGLQWLSNTSLGVGFTRWNVPGHEPWSLTDGEANTSQHVIWSADGKMAAILRSDGPPRIRDGVGGDILGTLPASHPAPVLQSITWTDNEHLRLGERIWNTRDGMPRRPTDSDPPLGAVVSPDGSRYAVVRDAEVVIFSQGKSNPLSTLVTRPGGPRWGPRWSPDGTRIVTGGRSAICWNVETGQKICEFQGAAPLAWSPDGKRVASGGYGHVWDAVTGEHLQQLARSNLWVGRELMWLDERILQLGTLKTGAVIESWNVETGELSEPAPWRGGHGVPSPDQRRVAAVYSIPSIIRLWNATTNQPENTVICLRDQYLMVDTNNRRHGSPRADREIVYLVLRNGVQTMITAAEFDAKYSASN